MERLTIQVGSFEVNCSILSENGKAWIVDPGQEGDRIARLLADRGLSPAAILLTHAHFDHVGGIPALQKAFPDLPVYVSEADAQVIAHPLNQLPPEYPAIKSLRGLKSLKSSRGLGEATNVEGLEVEVIETPGHTPGGVCYYFPNFSNQSNLSNLLLSGDTLFAGSVGRTDLPGGDMATLMASLEKLTALPDGTVVIPGHGMFTTIGDEKRGNPFLQ